MNETHKVQAKAKQCFRRMFLIFAVQADLDGKHTVFLFRIEVTMVLLNDTIYIFLVRNRDTLRCGFPLRSITVWVFPADRRGFDTACAAVDE